MKKVSVKSNIRISRKDMGAGKNQYCSQEKERENISNIRILRKEVSVEKSCQNQYCSPLDPRLFLSEGNRR